MKITIMTPVRVLGDGLAACFGLRPGMFVLAQVSDLARLRDALAKAEGDVALIDVTQGIDLLEVHAIAVKWPNMALVALGLEEQRDSVIRCGRAGFAGYVARSASIDTLCATLSQVVEGRLACSPEIAGGLLRALFRGDSRLEAPDPENALTRRECDVLQRIGRGLSNKEIARELFVSVATVKHHVHHVLQKLEVSGRSHAMRRVRDAPWIAATSSRTVGEERRVS